MFEMWLERYKEPDYVEPCKSWEGGYIVMGTIVGV